MTASSPGREAAGVGRELDGGDDGRDEAAADPGARDAEAPDSGARAGAPGAEPGRIGVGGRADEDAAAPAPGPAAEADVDRGLGTGVDRPAGAGVARPAGAETERPAGAGAADEVVSERAAGAGRAAGLERSVAGLDETGAMAAGGAAEEGRCVAGRDTVIAIRAGRGAGGKPSRAGSRSGVADGAMGSLPSGDWGPARAPGPAHHRARPHIARPVGSVTPP